MTPGPEIGSGGSGGEGGLGEHPHLHQRINQRR